MTAEKTDLSGLIDLVRATVVIGNVTGAVSVIPTFMLIKEEGLGFWNGTVAPALRGEIEMTPEARDFAIELDNTLRNSWRKVGAEIFNLEDFFRP